MVMLYIETAAYNTRACPKRLLRLISMDGLLQPDKPFHTQTTDLFIRIGC